MNSITPLSRMTYGSSAFSVSRRAVPDRDFWNTYETRFRGQYFLKATMNRVAEFVSKRIPENGRVLDLMSGKFTYVGESFKGDVHGIGLVRESLENNASLTSYEIKDLNVDPRVDDRGPYDAAIIAFGLNYLTKPLELLSSTYRALENSGKLIVVSSNNWQVTDKIPKIWREFKGSRIEIAIDYMEKAGFNIVHLDEIDMCCFWDINLFMLVGEKR